jgi:type II secretory pathway component GspD/PulD (secretin)
MNDKQKPESSPEVALPPIFSSPVERPSMTRTFFRYAALALLVVAAAVALWGIRNTSYAQQEEAATASPVVPTDTARQPDVEHQLGMALLNYFDEHKQFPPAASYSPDGTPLLSWRVLLLPYLGDEAKKLYSQFNLQEPWDSATNKPLLEKMPSVFLPQGKKYPANYTTWRAFTGDETIFRGAEGTPYNEIPDGISNTILVVESNKAVCWTQPFEIPFSTLSPTTHEGLDVLNGFRVLMADGSLRQIPRSYPVDKLKELITRKGSEHADASALAPFENDPFKNDPFENDPTAPQRPSPGEFVQALRKGGTDRSHGQPNSGGGAEFAWPKWEPQYREVPIAAARSYHLQNQKASEMVEALRKMYPGLQFVADERTNGVLLVGGSIAMHTRLNEFLKYSDLSPQEKAKRGLPDSIRAFIQSESPEMLTGESTPTRKVRPSASDAHSLEQQVRQEFDARQVSLKQQIQDFEQRLEQLRVLVAERDHARKAIIQRRVDELRNPSLRWDAADQAAAGQGTQGQPTSGNNRPQQTIADDDAKPKVTTATFPLRHIKSDTVTKALIENFRGSAGIQVSQASDSIKVAGVPDDLNRIRDLIKDLDVPPPADDGGGTSANDRKTSVFNIRHTKAETLLKTISTRFENSKSGVQLSLVPATNSILVSANPDEMQTIQVAIEQLDVPPPADDGGGTSLTELDGLWEGVLPPGVADTTPVEKRLRLVFYKNMHATFIGKTLRTACTFSITPSASPKRIALHGDEPKRGLYEVSGDGLRLSIAPTDAAFPTRFGTEKSEFKRINNAVPQELLDAITSHIQDVNWNKRAGNRLSESEADPFDDDEATQKPKTALEKALLEKTPANFEECPLNEVLDNIASKTKINIHIDEAALRALNVKPDSPVTVEFRQAIPLHTLLDHILSPLRLAYVVEGDVLTITSERFKNSSVLIPANKPVKLADPVLIDALLNRSANDFYADLAWVRSNAGRAQKAMDRRLAELRKTKPDATESDVEKEDKATWDAWHVAKQSLELLLKQLAAERAAVGSELKSCNEQLENEKTQLFRLVNGLVTEGDVLEQRKAVSMLARRIHDLDQVRGLYDTLDSQRTGNVYEVLPPDTAEIVDDLRRAGLEIHPTIHKQGDVDERKGLSVRKVLPDSPAAKAGLQENDFIVGAHTWETASLGNLWYALTQVHSRRPDNTSEDIKIWVWRDNQVISVHMPRLTTKPRH